LKFWENDLLQMVFSAGPMVKFVLALLLAFSVVSWAIIFFKYRQISRARKETHQFLEIFWKSRSLSVAYHEIRNLATSPVAGIFRVGYLELGKWQKARMESNPEGRTGEGESSGGRGFANFSRAMRGAMAAETSKLSKALTFLATTGNTAPFIGLFGTVWGIMNSFRGIGMRGGASLAVVAPGISEALIATAAGLAAAIPAVIAYNYFSSKVAALEMEMAHFSADFENIIERDFIRKSLQA
jgi:biopolymer transport protein TolQ